MILKKIAGTRDVLILSAKIREADTIAISGHLNPDGDCIGSCLGLCNYIRDQYPEKTVDVILDSINSKYTFLKYSDTIIDEDAARMAGLSDHASG